jgi:hypothetical protein
MRKLASLIAGSAMLLSSTLASAANFEGPLAPGGAANVREAQAQGLGTVGTVLIVTVVVVTVVVIASQSNSTTSST